jgi:RNA polymerase sigma-70 factor (ECF subfamily)
MESQTEKRAVPAVEDSVRAAYPTLWRAAMVLVDARADAEDAVQETVARAVAAYDGFRGESSPTTWMCRILVGIAGEIRRKKQRARQAERGEAEARKASEPVRGLEDREDLQAVLESLRSLPERQREAATLFYLEQLSYSEIAAALGISVGTVKSAISRARATIRSSLKVRGERKVRDGMP